MQTAPSLPLPFPYSRVRSRIHLWSRFIPTFIRLSDATMDSSDSLRSTAMPFVFSLIASASDGFNTDLRVIFPHHRLRKVSRGHVISFLFVPTIITTRILKPL